jgi:hypothetical protein
MLHKNTPIANQNSPYYLRNGCLTANEALGISQTKKTTPEKDAFLSDASLNFIVSRLLWCTLAHPLMKNIAAMK